MWALPLQGVVHEDVGVALDIEQDLAGGFVRLVKALQLVPVEPDPSASALADVNGHVGECQGRQGIAAGRALHGLFSKQRPSSVIFRH